MNKSCVIISGGFISDAFAKTYIGKINPVFLIGVDSGINFLYRNQMKPTHIVGDFDSADSKIIEYYKSQTNVPIRQFNPVKDASDTEIALRFALELGADEITLLGATGTRLDHVMANMQVLKIAHDAGVKACILDEYNRISLAKKEIVLKRETTFGDYFSIFPFGGGVEDVSIRGAKYPLEHYRLYPCDSRCVSNELTADQVTISFPQGMILLMETRDKNK